MELNQKKYKFRNAKNETITINPKSEIYLVINGKLTNIQLKQLFLEEKKNGFLGLSRETEFGGSFIGGWSILQNLNVTKNILTLGDKSYEMLLHVKETDTTFRIGEISSYTVSLDEIEIVKEQVAKYTELFDTELTPKQVEAVVETVEELKPTEGQLIYERVRDEWVTIEGFNEFTFGKENEFRFLYKAKQPERLVLITEDDIEELKLTEIDSTDSSTTYEFLLDKKPHNLTFDGKSINIVQVEKTVAQVQAEAAEAAKAEELKAEAARVEAENKVKKEAEEKEKAEMEAQAKTEAEENEKAEAKLKKEEEEKEKDEAKVKAAEEKAQAKAEKASKENTKGASGTASPNVGTIGHDPKEAKKEIKEEVPA